MARNSMNFITICLFVALEVAAQSVRGNPDVCGSTSANIVSNLQRVVGGQDAIPGQWPWQALLEIKEQNLSFIEESMCGGTLIYPKWVVSAAHCFQSDSITSIAVYFGVKNRTTSTEPTRQLRYVHTYYIHQDYSERNFFGDIALLKLHTEVEYNDYVRPACLPNPGSLPTSGQICTVSGYGETEGTGNDEILQYAEVEIISLDTCNAWYSEFEIEVPNDHICAGYENGSIDTCQGDSGGPLVCEESGKYFLYGITSFGYGCAEIRRPGAYTDVTDYLEWMENITGVKIATTIATRSLTTGETTTSVVKDSTQEFSIPAETPDIMATGDTATSVVKDSTQEFSNPAETPDIMATRDTATSVVKDSTQEFSNPTETSDIMATADTATSGVKTSTRELSNPTEASGARSGSSKITSSSSGVTFLAICFSISLYTILSG